MPRVLGIDTSLTGTGLARIDVSRPFEDGPIVHSAITATVSAPKPHKTDRSKRAMGRRVNALMVEIEAAITGDEPLPDLITVESLSYSARGDAAWVLPWIFGQVCALAATHDIPLVEVGTGQRAKYVTGSGNSDKDIVLLAVAKRWPEAEVTNNNEADAMAVGAVGCDYLGYPICQPTKYQAEVMAKIRETIAKNGGTP